MAGYHQQRDDSLSPREREVLELMAKGLTNGQIAERLDIAFDTAKSHVSAIISKLGVETREEAVRQWRREQRVGARFSRAMRGMVIGVGLGKVAAGVGGVAAVSASAVIGAAILVNGSDGDGTVLAVATSTATPTATPVQSVGLSDWLNEGIVIEETLVLGAVEYDGAPVELLLQRTETGWCFGLGRGSVLCPFDPPGEPRLEGSRVEKRGGGEGVWSGSAPLAADYVELVSAGGTTQRVELVDAPPALGFEMRFWIAAVARSRDVVEIRAMAGDGTVLATTGAYPEGQAHIVAYSEVDFRAGRWAGDPLAQRLPTDQSTGNRFLVEDAPQEIAFGVEHVGTSQIDVRYTCDIGTPGIPAEVRYDEPRGRGGAGRFVLVVPDGATLCQWWIGDWDGDFRIVSAE